MQDRDFKGVWIPKEIWLNPELSVTDRVLLAEIDSLDNENHCTASNEYFAEFFHISVPTITRSIKRLKELGLIETKMVTTNSGSYRIMWVTWGSNQNDERGLIKMIRDYNSDNNITSKKDETAHSEIEFDFGMNTEKPKQNLYQKCASHIYSFTDDNKVQKALFEYLDFLLEKSRTEKKPIYENQWKGLLKKLKDIDDKIGSIQYSIQKGYVGFYEPPTQFSNTTPDTNKAVQHNSRPEDWARNADGSFVVF